MAIDTNNMSVQETQKEDVSEEARLFETVLRQMSMEAFHAIIEYGVRDLDTFLSIGENQLRKIGLPSHIVNEILSARNTISLDTVSGCGKGDEPSAVPFRDKQKLAPSQLTYKKATSNIEDSRKRRMLSTTPGFPYLPCKISRRAYNVLKRNGISTVAEFLSLREANLRSFSNAGIVTVGELLELQDLIRHRASDIDDNYGLTQLAHWDLGLITSGNQNTPESYPTTAATITATTGGEVHIDRKNLIPTETLHGLSKRARNVLRRNGILTAEQLLSLSALELLSFRGAGIKTVHELVHLQNDLRGGTVGSDGLRARDIREPEEWSILRKPLRTFELASLQTLLIASNPSKAKSIGDLELSHKDLESLRTIAMFPHDLLEDLWALSFSILTWCGISDNGFSIIMSELHSLPSNEDGHYQLEVISDIPLVNAGDIEGLPTAWLQAFDIPVDVINSLNAIDVYTFQDSLGISERDVIERYGWCTKSFRSISSLWMLREYTRSVRKQIQEEIHIPYSSFEELWDTFVASVAPTRRERRILEGRLGVLKDRKWTLEELGMHEGITRERVRQIAKKLMRKIRHRSNQLALRLVWNAMEYNLSRSGGVCTAIEMADFLHHCFSWPNPPTPRHVIAISDLHGSFMVVEKDEEPTIMFFCSHPCLQCEIAKHNLIELVANAEDGIPLDEAGRSLRKRCKTSCTLQFKGNDSFSSGYILQLISETDGVRAQGPALFPEEAWALRFGSVLETVESALLAAGQAIHFSELTNEIQRLGRNISERSIHACLSQRLEAALLWNTGTYIHRKYVKIPFDLIRMIEIDVIKRLEDGLPLLCVNGVFLKYEGQLRQRDVSTDQALYSCLRVSKNPALAHMRYPYITLARRGSRRPTVYSVLEDFVREHEEGITVNELTDYLVSDLGVSDQLKHNYLYSLQNVIQVGVGSYMHLDHLSIDPTRFRSIRDYTDELLEDMRQVSVDKIFGDKQITCKCLGVSTPIMLYSLLQTYYGDRYTLPRYPVVARADTTGKVGVVAQMADYVRDLRRPCSTDELLAHFVDRLGFSESSIYNVRYCEHVLQYTKGTLLHIDTLEWTAHKQQTIEDIALAHLCEQGLLGKPYGLLDKILESRQLPHLPPCAPWTATLLGEVLCHEDRFRVIGTRRNAFVRIPNEQHIEDLQSLLYNLLRTKYDGAASLQEFEAYLRDTGIMSRALTPYMLGNQNLVCIEGNVVLLTDLRL